MELEKRVMTIGRGILFPKDADSFEGFKSVADCDYRDRIKRECRFESRIGSDDKVIFVYIVFLNPVKREAYAFSRMDKLSIYIQGNIHREDFRGENRLKDPFEIVKDPFKVGAIREANKQIGLEAKAKLDNCQGFINLEIGEYKPRFGILYFALTDSSEIKTHSRRTRVVPLKFGGKLSLQELDRLCAENQIDECSKSIKEPLREYLSFL